MEVVEPLKPADPDFTKTSMDADSAAIGNRTIGTCDDIAEEVRNCTDCVLHTKRLVAVPGGGGKRRAKLLIVGGWLVEDTRNLAFKESIFGIEEDGMVARMVSAIHLSSEEVFITNVIKCAVDESCRPTVENIKACFSYLRRQIQILDPVVICAMGIDATKSLVKSSKPLSQLRGKVYPFTVSERRTIPVIPTYHPTFLLKNPEFKRATWEDLQSIAKYL